jgi:hypothetical protein
VRIAYVAVTALAFGLFTSLALVEYGDRIWDEVSSPEYADESDKLGLEKLYSRYQRDMSLMPEVHALTPVLAKRGAPAAMHMMDSLERTKSVHEIRNSVFVFREMRRIGSFDVCGHAEMHRRLMRLAGEVDVSGSFGVSAVAESLCNGN